MNEKNLCDQAKYREAHAAHAQCPGVATCGRTEPHAAHDAAFASPGEASHCEGWPSAPCQNELDHAKTRGRAAGPKAPGVLIPVSHDRDVSGTFEVLRMVVYRQPNGIPFIAVDEKSNEGWGGSPLNAVENCLYMRGLNERGVAPLFDELDNTPIRDGAAVMQSYGVEKTVVIGPSLRIRHKGEHAYVITPDGETSEIPKVLADAVLAMVART